MTTSTLQVHAYLGVWFSKSHKQRETVDRTTMEVVHVVLDENNREWMVRYKALALVKNILTDLASFGNNSRDSLVMRDGQSSTLIAGISVWEQGRTVGDDRRRESGWGG